MDSRPYKISKNFLRNYSIYYANLLLFLLNYFFHHLSNQHFPQQIQVGNIFI